MIFIKRTRHFTNAWHVNNKKITMRNYQELRNKSVHKIKLESTIYT